MTQIDVTEIRDCICVRIYVYINYYTYAHTHIYIYIKVHLLVSYIKNLIRWKCKD